MQYAPRKHSAILSTFNKLPFVVLSIFQWPLTVHRFWFLRKLHAASNKVFSTVNLYCTWLLFSWTLLPRFESGKCTWQPVSDMTRLMLLPPLPMTWEWSVWETSIFRVALLLCKRNKITLMSYLPWYILICHCDIFCQCYENDLCRIHGPRHEISNNERPAIPAVWSEPLLVTWIFHEY